MNVDFMIILDRFVGVPICWFLSQVYKIERIFQKNKEIPIKKILFLKPSEMGTSVMVYPTIKRANEIFPGVEVYFLVFEENLEILKVLDMVKEENILVVRTSSFFLFIKDVIATLLRLRRERIDATIDLEFFARATNIISYLSGARKRVGFYRFNMQGLYRGDLLTHKVNYNYNVHTGIAFMSLLHALEYKAEDMPLRKGISMEDLKVPKIESGAESITRIWNKLKKEHGSIDSIDFLKKIVILNPNTSQLIPFRKWPLEYYCSLAKKVLSEHEDSCVVITGIKKDIPDGLAICQAVNDQRCINLAGKTSIKELIDLFNISKVFVSVDSGSVHFAALTDINIICIFGPDTPILFSPLSKNCLCLTSGYVCNPCMSVFNERKPMCRDKIKPCLKSISVDRVYGEVGKLL